MKVPIVPLVVATALFMETMDSTILATALPTIARDIGVDPIALKLAVTSYLLGLAVLVPISGWMADRLGARTTFRTALAVFMVASIGCAFSRSLEGFAAWRLVQGLGGAMMVPVGRLVILRSTAKAELVRALAFLTVPSLMGPVLGPPLGGLIVTIADWRWIFFVNIPIGLLGIVLATIYFRDEPQPRQPLDLKGFVLAATALSGVIVGTSIGGRHIAPTWVAVAAVGVGVLAGWGYWHHARRTERPLLDLTLFKLATFQSGVAGGFLFRIGIGASAFLVPLLLQIGFGIEPLTAGLITLAGALGSLIMKPATGPILRRFGFRRVLVGNALISAAALASVALISAQTPYVAVAGLLLLAGFTRSLQFTSLHAITYADVESDRASAATSIASVAQQVSIGTGVAVGALVLELSQHVRGHATPMAGDFSVAILAVAAISAASLLSMMRLPPDAGRELARREAAEQDGEG